MATYLDFEQKIKTLQDEIEMANLRGDEDVKQTLERNLKKEAERTYKNTNELQKLQLARHPDRPYALDYIELILEDAYEISGDRHFGDDKAIICYLGKMDGQSIMVIGEEKGRGTKMKIARNFGMPHPEGYRKALKAAKLAEKFGIPVLMLIDTAGAYPGIGAEERGQSEAIAKNLQEFSSLKVPTVAIIIGEGGSGGALAIGVADRLAMLEHSIFSVISPEGCAAILWNDPSKVEVATRAMKITADELKGFEIIDDILYEPDMGAHRDKERTAKTIREYFLKSVQSIKKDTDFIEKRYQKLMSYGAFFQNN